MDKIKNKIIDLLKKVEVNEAKIIIKNAEEQLKVKSKSNYKNI